VAAGEIPPNPAELLGSGRMTDAIAAWRSRFAYIVIDSPPVLPVTDSVVLSKITDLTLVVARYNMTERRSVERSCRLLERGRNQKVQVILNAVERSGEINYQYYGCKDFTSALGDTQRA
jgi:polysaccharide biosynthesis transport protein